MKINARHAAHSIAVNGKHLARLIIDLSDTDTPTEDMHALAQKLRSLADMIDGEARILARAPKPKPAWHDAVAVIASTDDCERQVWERDSSGWNGTAGDTATTEELRNVTPLIEAKVTHQMVNRILDRIDDHFDAHPARIGEEIAVAALGLETR